MKTNPLFVDSMRVRGDVILTQVELHGVLDSSIDEVRIFIKKLNHQELYAPLFKTIEDESIWKGLIRLDHQEEIAYHFEIFKDSQSVCTTPEAHGLASYLLQEHLTSGETTCAVTASPEASA